MKDCFLSPHAALAASTAADFSAKDIFDEPQFYIDGMTANDVRQGRDGDCWFMSSICTLSNKEDLLEKVCVARDEKVGVYGFVFHRGTLAIRKNEIRRD